MDKNWRPDSYKNPYTAHTESSIEEGKYCFVQEILTKKQQADMVRHNAYEEGASAMLQGLIDQPQKPQKSITSPPSPNAEGITVFIPNEGLVAI